MSTYRHGYKQHFRFKSVRYLLPGINQKARRIRFRLRAQQAYIEHFYKDKPILAEFTDIRSGKTITKRPELQKALALCEKERATRVVAKIDWLSRNTENARCMYKKLGERLERCDIPNLDKFTLTLFMAIADRERVRTQQAVEARPGG